MSMMFGWRILLTARASSLKRRIRSACAAASGESTLIATCLPISGWRPAYTTPIPPSPSLCVTWYSPTTAPGSSAFGSGLVGPGIAALYRDAAVPWSNEGPRRRRVDRFGTARRVRDRAGLGRPGAHGGRRGSLREAEPEGEAARFGSASAQPTVRDLDRRRSQGPGGSGGVHACLDVARRDQARPRIQGRQARRARGPSGRRLRRSLHSRPLALHKPAVLRRRYARRARR